ncbi:MAG: hypothetical protein WA941_00860 [Nitrososphaeraceae archaeon]
MTTKTVQQRIQWRRDKVREYSIKGYTQWDNSAELQISLGLVERRWLPNDSIRRDIECTGIVIFQI